MNTDMRDLYFIVKLISGETLVCTVIEDDDERLIIRDPFIINTLSKSTSNGVRSSVFYSPWFMSTTQRVHMIRKMHVVSAAIPDDSLRDEYAQMIAQKDEPKPKNEWPFDPNFDRLRN